MTEPPRPGPDGISHLQHAKRSRLLGIVVAIVCLAGFTVLHLRFPALQGNLGLLLVAPPLGLFTAALVLAIIPRTASFGGGLLIGMGISLVVGAGLCVAVLSAFAQA